MNRKCRDDVPDKAVGRRGIERGTGGATSGRASGLNKSGLSAGERGKTRASSAIGHSEVTETHASYGPSRYGVESKRRT